MSRALYAVIMPPMFQEDAGRYFLFAVFPSREKADAFVFEQVAKSKGYYSPSSYYIFVKEVEDQTGRDLI